MIRRLWPKCQPGQEQGDDQGDEAESDADRQGGANALKDRQTQLRRRLYEQLSGELALFSAVG